ncbi:MAG: IS30 family transposase [Bacteroidales bacterium]|nr:IS30 family transposase [Bacteroidales bacterium]
MDYMRITKQERQSIQRMLNRGFSPNKIAIELERSPSTILREIKRNRVRIVNGKNSYKKVLDSNCAHAAHCFKQHLCVDCIQDKMLCRLCERCNAVCDDFRFVSCPRRDAIPWTCNACEQRRTCKLVKYYYRADEAQVYAQQKLKESRTGLAISDEELQALDTLITPLLNKGQSVHHVYMTHADKIPVSEKTLYAYIDANLLQVDVFKMPRKISRKPRRKRPERRVDSGCYICRSYRDYLNWCEANPGANTIEMDTVEGTRGSGKVLLTLKWMQSAFLMAYVLEQQTAAEVTRLFQFLQNGLGREHFQQLFPVILTDRGSEFTNPRAIEGNLQAWTKVFFCDPQKPQQKPHIENEHSLLRRKLPKGMCFKQLTQEDIQIVLAHTNSYKRQSRDQKSPLEIFRFTYGEDLAAFFNIKHLAPDEVDLTVYKKIRD